MITIKAEDLANPVIHDCLICARGFFRGAVAPTTCRRQTPVVVRQTPNLASPHSQVLVAAFLATRSQTFLAIFFQLPATVCLARGWCSRFSCTLSLSVLDLETTSPPFSANLRVLPRPAKKHLDFSLHSESKPLKFATQDAIRTRRSGKHEFPPKTAKNGKKKKTRKNSIQNNTRGSETAHSGGFAANDLAANDLRSRRPTNEDGNQCKLASPHSHVLVAQLFLSLALKLSLPFSSCPPPHLLPTWLTRPVPATPLTAVSNPETTPHDFPQIC
jgi:hypothetical protein